MTYPGVSGTMRDSCAMLRFQVPSREVRMFLVDQYLSAAEWMFECKLHVDPTPEYPDLPSGDWMCRITADFHWSSSTKITTFNIGTKVIPPDNVTVFHGDLVHFIVTGQNFSDKGKVSGCPYLDQVFGHDVTWNIQSDGIRDKTIARAASAEIITNGSAWTYILAPKETLGVELMFPVRPNHSEQKPSLPVRLWNGFNSKVHADCVLVSRDEKEFPAHRFILASGSSVFAAMFEHDMQEKRSGVCRIDDINGEVLEIILEFLYTDRADLGRIKDVVEEVYKAADKYAVEELCRACENIMMASLSVKTALPYLDFAVRHGLRNLKTRTIQFMYANIEEI